MIPTVTDEEIYMRLEQVEDNSSKQLSDTDDYDARAFTSRAWVVIASVKQLEKAIIREKTMEFQLKQETESRGKSLQVLFIDKIELTINFPWFNYQMLFMRKQMSFSIIIYISVRINIIMLVIYESLNVRKKVFILKIYNFLFLVKRFPYAHWIYC